MNEKQAHEAYINACERIESWAKKHVSSDLTPLPRDNSQPYLLASQVASTIADWLDRATVSPKPTRKGKSDASN